MNILIESTDFFGKIRCFTDFNPAVHTDMIDKIDSCVELDDIGVFDKSKRQFGLGYIIFPPQEFDRYTLRDKLQNLGFKVDIL